MLDDGDKAVSYDCRANLYSDSVLCSAPEFLNLEVLLEPLEEQLNLPSVLVEIGNFESGKMECVRQECEVFKDPVVTILIRCGKCRFRYWVMPHAKVVTLGLVSLQCNDNITQALTITKLSEHECHELIPAGEVLDIAITTILANKIIEVILY